MTKFHLSTSQKVIILRITLNMLCNSLKTRPDIKTGHQHAFSVKIFAALCKIGYNVLITIQNWSFSSYFALEMQIHPKKCFSVIFVAHLQISVLKTKFPNRCAMIRCNDYIYIGSFLWKICTIMTEKLIYQLIFSGFLI